MSEAAAHDLAWLDAWLRAHADELVAFRRQLHAHPELSWEEYQTTEAIVRRLEVGGLSPTVLPAGTGCLCDVSPAGSTPGGRVGGGRVVALRADIDALAMDDEKDVHYRSQVEGTAHACGHDVHTAIVLGAGLALAELARRDGLPGTVRLVFQPAEEQVPGGALAVIDAGGLDGVDAIFGVHCDPKLDVGLLGVRAGAITSAADMLEIELHGPGGHTARPERTVDLVALAARIVDQLPHRAAAVAGGSLQVVFGAVHAGDAGNVIPARAVLKGTARTPDHQVWARAEQAVAASLAALVAEAGGATGAADPASAARAELRYVRGIPPVVNDPGATAVLARGAARALGEHAVVPTEQSAGGDDFAWFVDKVPGCYARLGTHDPTGDGPRHDLHASHFDVDERAIDVGIRVLVAATIEALARPA